MDTQAIKIGDKEFVKYGNAEHSVIGKNRFYHYCEFKNQRVCYGVCAGIIDAHIEGRDWTKNTDVSEESCTVAIKHKKCAGMSKRQLERKVDASLFYVPRLILDGELVKHEGNRNASYQMGWNKVGSLKTESKPIAQPVVSEPVKKQQPSAVPSYADAINEALKA
jgi:hypothetical protein